MRNLMRMLVAIILVLSFSILAQPQPGAGATAFEYNRFCGEIAIPGEGFKPAEIGFFIGEPNTTGDLFIGKFGIKINGNDNWRVFDCTTSVNATTGELYVTTNTVEGYQALLCFDTDSNSVYLQVPGQGISGFFTECPQ
jgi:hypothetical protein